MRVRRSCVTWAALLLLMLISSVVLADPSGDVLRLRATCNGASGGRMYDYIQFSTAGQNSYVINSNDYLEYDVYLHTNHTGIGGIDVMNTACNWARFYGGWVDDQGVDAYPWSNITSKAYRRWYHRKVRFPSAMWGTTVHHWDVAVDGTYGWETVSAMYDNVKITRSGSTVLTIYTDGATSTQYHDTSSTASIDASSLITTSTRKWPVRVGAHLFYWNSWSGADSMRYRPWGLGQTSYWNTSWWANAQPGQWAGYGTGYGDHGGDYSSMTSNWWEAEFEDMKQAGIDFVSLVCWGEYPDTSFQISTCVGQWVGTPAVYQPGWMVQALDRSGCGLKVALFDDTNSEVCDWNYCNGRGYTNSPAMPLSDTSTWSYFYDRKIKLFFNALPRQYWATHNGASPDDPVWHGRPIIIVYVAQPTAGAYTGLSTYGASMWQTIKACFARDFKDAQGNGIQPFIVFDRSWYTQAGSSIPADSYYRWDADYASMDEAGGYRTSEIQPGFDSRMAIPSSQGAWRPRYSGTQLIHAYNQQYNPGSGSRNMWNSDLVLVETWNELWEGTAICRALTYTSDDGPIAPGWPGYNSQTYVNPSAATMTPPPGAVLSETHYMDRWRRECVESSIGRWDYDATFRRTWEVPTTIVHGSTVIPVKVRNDGLNPWDPSASPYPFKICYWLENSAGAYIPGTDGRILFASTVFNGDAVDTSFTAPSTWPSGTYYLRFDVTADGSFLVGNYGDLARPKVQVTIQ